MWRRWCSPRAGWRYIAAASERQARPQPRLPPRHAGRRGQGPRHAATLHSDSVSRVGVITIPGFAYLIGNLAQRAGWPGCANNGHSLTNLLGHTEVQNLRAAHSPIRVFVPTLSDRAAIHKTNNAVKGRTTVAPSSPSSSQASRSPTVIHTHARLARRRKSKNQS